MFKKVLSIVLALAMILSLGAVTSFAANSARDLSIEEATAVQLKSLNLFRGVSESNFDLGRAPSRIEALVIMLRLLGKESEILAGTYQHPFNDVPLWANNYVGYAYENGLTKGISATKFGTDNASAAQFMTFVLRAMDYSDSNGDFTWDNPFKLAKEIGVLDDSIVVDNGFLRADCGSICFNALGAKLKDGAKTLGDKLISENVFTKTAYDAALEKINILRQANPFANIPSETPEQKERFAELMKYWKNFGLSADSKGLTLTWDQARALVGQDITVVQQYVRTIADCLYYLCASGYGTSGGDITVAMEGKNGDWHFNRSAEIVFAENCGDCGGTSNLVAYLLKGDYDEVGYMNYSSAPGQGGHVVNYVKNGNVYLGFDMVLPMSAYRYGIKLHKGNDLNKLAYDTLYSSDTKIIYTYKGEKGDFPIGWTFETTQYAIKGYDDTLNVAYAAEGYKFVELEQSSQVMDKIYTLRNTMWYAKRGNTHEPATYVLEADMAKIGIVLRVLNVDSNIGIVFSSVHGFGYGKRDLLIELLYNGEKTTDFTLNSENSSVGQVIKGTDGLIHCNYLQGTGEIPFTITVNGESRAVTWKIS